MGCYITVKGNQLDNFLLASLFIKQPTQTVDGTKDGHLNHITIRESIVPGACACLRNSRHKRMLDRGLRRIDRELDVVRFIKHQMMLKSIRNIMFTIADRYLLSHNREQVLWSHSETDPSSSDLEHDDIPHETPFYS